jgi:hypothetical protein
MRQPYSVRKLSADCSRRRQSGGQWRSIANALPPCRSEMILSISALSRARLIRSMVDNAMRASSCGISGSRAATSVGDQRLDGFVARANQHGKLASLPENHWHSAVLACFISPHVESHLFTLRLARLDYQFARPPYAMPAEGWVRRGSAGCRARWARAYGGQLRGHRIDGG